MVSMDKIVRLLVTVFAASAFLLSLAWSRHWPLFHDAAIMHYVVFLMGRGWRPYVDIVDINMPGSYMVEWFAMHVFGQGSIAWRCFDIATMLVTITSACWIFPKEDRWAGLLAGLSMSVFHLSNGPADVGERDWTLMVLLLVGFAFYVSAIRFHRPVLLFFFSAISGFATAIKPPALPLVLLLICLAIFVLHRERTHAGVLHAPIRPYVFFALAGAMVPALVVLAFLLHYHAAHAFLVIARGLIPFYATTGNLPLPYLLRVALGIYFLTIVAIAVAVGFMNGTWRQWETQALALGATIGAFLYLSQRKGWQQHKETLFVFLLLFVTAQFSIGLKRKGLNQIVSACGLILLALILVKWSWSVRSYTWSLASSNTLQADLEALNLPGTTGEPLARNVQCVEMVTGCINTLYNMRMEPATGFIFDSFLFTPAPTAPIKVLRSQFLAELNRRPPFAIVVEASDWDADQFSYNRLTHWNDFNSFLSGKYSLQREYNANGIADRGSYRLYTRDK